MTRKPDHYEARARELAVAAGKGRRKMKFWFDTEFYEDGTRIDLISIGVAAEDDRLYYAEVIGADEIALRTEWLEKNVRPHLTGPQKYRRQIARELIEFMGESPEIWAYYADYDWVVLCQLFGRMIDLPKGWPMYCRDLKQLVDQCGAPKLPEQVTAEHNAMGDAMWTKSSWLWLRERQHALEPVRA